MGTENQNQSTNSPLQGKAVKRDSFDGEVTAKRIDRIVGEGVAYNRFHTERYLPACA